MKAERRSGLQWKRIAVGLAAFIATPFVVTGIYRVLPNSTPYWLWNGFPFAVLALLALALWFVSAVPRSVSIGIGAGLIAHALLLMFLFAAMGSTDF